MQATNPEKYAHRRIFTPPDELVSTPSKCGVSGILTFIREKNGIVLPEELIADLLTRDYLEKLVCRFKKD